MLLLADRHGSHAGHGGVVAALHRVESGHVGQHRHGGDRNAPDDQPQPPGLRADSPHFNQIASTATPPRCRCGPQHALQQPPDRRRGQQRPVQYRRLRGHAGRLGRNASRSASTSSRSCSSSCRPTTFARECSPAAASTRSRAVARTRSAGSAFYVFRDQSLVGDGIDNRPIATFNDKQFGGTLGGPIVRTRHSSSATSSGAARTRHRDSRCPATPAWLRPAGRGPALPRHHAAPLRLQPGGPGRVHPRHRERQDLRARRLQPRRTVSSPSGTTTSTASTTSARSRTSPTSSRTTSTATTARRTRPSAS